MLKRTLLCPFDASSSFDWFQRRVHKSNWVQLYERSQRNLPKPLCNKLSLEMVHRATRWIFHCKTSFVCHKTISIGRSNKFSSKGDEHCYLVNYCLFYLHINNFLEILRHNKWQKWLRKWSKWRIGEHMRYCEIGLERLPLHCAIRKPKLSIAESCGWVIQDDEYTTKTWARISTNGSSMMKS